MFDAMNAYWYSLPLMGQAAFILYLTIGGGVYQAIMRRISEGSGYTWWHIFSNLASLIIWPAQLGYLFTYTALHVADAHARAERNNPEI